MEIKDKLRFLRDDVRQMINSRKSLQSIEKKIGKEYLKTHGRELNWDDPKAYTEKISVAKIYNASEDKTRLTDKYLVRSWIKDKIGEKYLIPLYGVYEKFEDIDFNMLEKKNGFVLKCNHDCGSTTIIRPGETINKKMLKKKFDHLLKMNYAYVSFEEHYKTIKPLILAEKLMCDGKLKDYKFLCFNGVAQYCWVDVDRFSNDHRRNIYDKNWNLQPFYQRYRATDYQLPRPKNYKKMIEIAEKLSRGFDHVRVDLYDVEDKIYFGEMTFTNGSGLEKWTPDNVDFDLGKLWEFRSGRDRSMKKFGDKA